MAAVVSTKANNTGSSGDVTVTKPTSLAVGDLMIAFITSSTSGPGGEAHSGPSGWTKLEEQLPSNGTILTVWGVVATSTQTAASDFAWTSGSTNDTTIGTIYRVTGNGFLSLAVNVLSDSGNSGDYPTATFSGLTTVAADSLIFLCGASETTGGTDVDFSGYSVVNNNPTWTEQDDLGNGAGLRANIGVATATYTPKQATGNYSITMSADGGDISSAIVVVTENISVSTSPSVLSVATSVQAPTVTGGASTSPAVISVAATVQDPTVTTPADVWSKQAKNTTTWTTQDKS